MYRDRIKSNHEIVWHACQKQRRRIDPVTRAPLGDWTNLGLVYSQGFTESFEQLKDYSGPVRLEKDCHHVKSIYTTAVVSCDPTYFDGEYEYRLHQYQLDATKAIHGMDADAWPIDKSAVAIGRIPAFASSQAQNLVSIAELYDVGDSLAAKSAIALARVVGKAYKALRTKAPTKGEEFLDVLGLTYNPRTKTLKRVGQRGSITDRVRHVSTTAMSVDMEWKYGWAPLVGEIRESARVIREFDRIKQRLTKGTRLFGRASSERSASYEGTYDKYSYSPFAPTVFGGSKLTRSTWTASVVRRVKPEYAETFLGAGLHDLRIWGEVLNIEPTLANGWQYLPLSFVGDWFLPVSEFLDALGGLKNPLAYMFETHAPILTCKTMTIGQCTVMDVSTGMTVTGQLHRETYVRDTNRHLVPNEVYLPQLRTPTSLGKWWSMVEIGLSGFLTGKYKLNKRVRR